MKQTVKIKICGLRRTEDIAIVNAAQPDYIGFVFAKGRREVSEETAAQLAALLDPRIQKVGVFVDAPQEQVIHLLQSGIIDLAQLHGTESEEMVHLIREATGKPVIRTRILLPEEKKIPDTEAEYLLLDSGKGSGRCLDWQSVAKLQGINKPYFLAGGLSPENVAEALKQLSGCLPYAVDVSSGVETDGCKDKIKVHKFIEQVRAWCSR